MKPAAFSFSPMLNVSREFNLRILNIFLGRGIYLLEGQHMWPTLNKVCQIIGMKTLCLLNFSLKSVIKRVEAKEGGYIGQSCMGKNDVIAWDLASPSFICGMHHVPACLKK